MTNVDIKWQEYMKACEKYARATDEAYAYVENRGPRGASETLAVNARVRDELECLTRSANLWARAKLEHEKKYGASK